MMTQQSNWLFFSNADESTLCDYGWRVARENEGTEVRFVRGHKMRNINAAFAELSAAFQFPYYFGENYDALAECLGDLDWIECKRIVMIVTRFEEVLVEEPIEILAFGQTLRGAVNAFSRSRQVAADDSENKFSILLNSKFGEKDVPEKFIEALGQPSILRIDSSV
jgi:RNAse (barnase) inhibitor barstar